MLFDVLSAVLDVLTGAVPAANGDPPPPNPK